MKKYLVITGIYGTLAVAFGAIGGHVMKKFIDLYYLDIYKTAVQYHFWHTLAMLIVGIGMTQPSLAALLRWFKLAFICFATGIALFCGSLYLLCLATAWQTPLNELSYLTPIGGFCFILGWGVLIIAGIKSIKIS